MCGLTRSAPSATSKARSPLPDTAASPSSSCSHCVKDKRVPHSQIAGWKIAGSSSFRRMQSRIFWMRPSSRSVATMLCTPRYFAQNMDKKPVPAPSSMTRFPRTRACPAGVERNEPRCRAASQVRKPVVPAERIRPRDSQVMIVRLALCSPEGVPSASASASGTGAVYLT